MILYDPDLVLLFKKVVKRQKNLQFHFLVVQVVAVVVVVVAKEKKEEKDTQNTQKKKKQRMKTDKKNADYWPFLAGGCCC